MNGRTRAEHELLEGKADAVVAELLAERRRQIDTEGFTPKHDERHPVEAFARAASSYALLASDLPGAAMALYPFDNPEKLAGKTARRALVVAGALIVAAIERLDREGVMYGDEDAA
jgi:hypothetical protein